MPLKPGEKNIGSNIKELKKAGYPIKQAMAIAIHEASKKLKNRKK